MRCPIVVGETRKVWAIRAASRPRTVWSIRGVGIAGSIAGWAHTKSSFKLSSGNSAGKVTSLYSSLEWESGLALYGYSLMTHKIGQGMARRPRQAGLA